MKQADISVERCW